MANVGKNLSLLGFGCMRLPVIDGADAHIDEAKAIQMIRDGIDCGINYIDTAYMYHGGNSEVVVGKALKDGYREKVWLADKLAAWYAKEPEDLDTIFEEQLRRLDDDYIDLYLIHNIDEANWKRVLRLGVIDFVKQLKEDGKIGHYGFSFHGSSAAFFKEVLDYTDWEFCQIQFNYMDTHIQAGLEGLLYAGEKGIPVVVMEPLKGGKLIDELPPTVQAYFDQLGSTRSPVDWALSWVADFPEVMTILSGMNTPQQLVENIDILSVSEPNSMSDEELQILENAAAEYNKLIRYGCTKCQYCMPCAVGINIPTIIDYLNQYSQYAGSEKIVNDFKMFIQPTRKVPSTCVQCGKCEDACPQHLKIMTAMSESAAIFEQGENNAR
jgi:predicted aldo/keto reductase-like oxidoreductase